MTNVPANLTTGNSITPLDGRNYLKISELSGYFSEFALTKYRVKVELAYLVYISKLKIIPGLSPEEKNSIGKIAAGFSFDDYRLVKEIEKRTNHDIKAVEYFIKDKFGKSGLGKFSPFIHLFLTSEDTNNLAYGLMLKDFNKDIASSRLKELLGKLGQLAKKYKRVAMLARTHGQPAVGTTVGKELANYCHRLGRQLAKIKDFEFDGKLNGAVGNLNANKTLMPKTNWLKVSREFVESLGLKNNQYTTQILFYDNWLEYFQIMSLVNGILVDLSVNIWQMIMLNIFVLRKKEGEVGSSTMPQKVNPINFEHAEGNLQMANSMMEFFVRKLTSSRLQRDLSDSTVRRNFGEALGYSLLGWLSVGTGLEKLDINQKQLKSDLDNHWEILSEAIQTALRIRKDQEGYEKIKKKTRGKVMDQKLYKQILKDLGLENNKNLNDLTPETYTGYAEELVDRLNY